MEFSGHSLNSTSQGNLVISRDLPRVGIGTDIIDGNLEIADINRVSLILNRDNQSISANSKSVLQFQNNDTLVYEIGTWVDSPGLYFFRSDGNPTMYLNAAGKVGIGTSSPAALLELRDSETTGAAMRIYKTGQLKMQVWENGGLGVGTSLTSWIPSNGLFVDGDVNIGRAHKTGYKLSVDGKIVSEEVLVELSEDWPDYVFEPDYQLMPLTELKTVLDRQKHLPGIPSASDIQDNGGVHLGDMQTRLLKKIEELTLYVIELESKYRELENRIAACKNSYLRQ
jgi:hypothetical protein